MPTIITWHRFATCMIGISPHALFLITYLPGGVFTIFSGCSLSLEWEDTHEEEIEWE